MSPKAFLMPGIMSKAGLIVQPPAMVTASAISATPVSVTSLMPVCSVTCKAQCKGNVVQTNEQFHPGDGFFFFLCTLNPKVNVLVCAGVGEGGGGEGVCERKKLIG